MKRWDEIVFVKNLTLQGDNMAEQVIGVLEAARLKALACEDSQAAERLKAALQGMDLLGFWRQLVLDAVSGKYPMMGVQPWMLDGQCDNLRHRFEAGINTEAVMLRCAQYLQHRIARVGHKSVLPDGAKEAADALVALLTTCEVTESMYLALVLCGVLDNVEESKAVEAMLKKAYDRGFAACHAEQQAKLEQEAAEIEAARQKVLEANRKKRGKKQKKKST